MHRVIYAPSCVWNESAKTTQALAGAESRTAQAVVPRADGDEALVCRARRSPAPPLSPDPTPSGRGTRWAMKSASGQYRHVRPSRHGAPLTGAGETRENTVNRASVKK
jgi:hypothetical protein